jgi:hypothetical protein
MEQNANDAKDRPTRKWYYFFYYNPWNSRFHQIGVLCVVDDSLNFEKEDERNSRNEEQMVDKTHRAADFMNIHLLHMGGGDSSCTIRLREIGGCVLCATSVAFIRTDT